MLTGKTVSKNFGGLKALSNIDFHVGEKEIVGLIGPNGSGKTTLFNVISGIYKPDGGTILFKDVKIAGRSPYQIAEMGIGRTFQIVRPFLNMSSLENVAVALLYGRRKLGRFSKAQEEALALLRFVGLEDKKDVLTKNLTLPDRKSLQVARTLAIQPEIILLDEVLAGLNPVEMEQAMNVIKRIRKDLGVSVFIIEHNMRAIMKLSDRIIAIHHGMKIAEGKPEEVTNNQAVIEAYLGKSYA
jgi:branched-chain amino acid transport system ATP-binding protein